MNKLLDDDLIKKTDLEKEFTALWSLLITSMFGGLWGGMLLGRIGQWISPLYYREFGDNFLWIGLIGILLGIAITAVLGLQIRFFMSVDCPVGLVYWALWRLLLALLGGWFLGGCLVMISSNYTGDLGLSYYGDAYIDIVRAAGDSWEVEKNFMAYTWVAGSMWGLVLSFPLGLVWAMWQLWVDWNNDIEKKKKLT